MPVSENGVKEYNTIGTDERIRIVHIPKNELRLVDSKIDNAHVDDDAVDDDGDGDVGDIGAAVEGGSDLCDGDNSNKLCDETIPDEPNKTHFSEDNDGKWANQDESNKAQNLPMNK